MNIKEAAEAHVFAGMQKIDNDFGRHWADGLVLDGSKRKTTEELIFQLCHHLDVLTGELLPKEPETGRLCGFLSSGDKEEEVALWNAWARAINERNEARLS